MPEPTEVQTANVPFAFFDAVQYRDAVAFRERDERTGDAQEHTVSLSTGGLGRALSALKPHCGSQT
jgi:hypothetical protein